MSDGFIEHFIGLEGPIDGVLIELLAQSLDSDPETTWKLNPGHFILIS